MIKKLREMRETNRLALDREEIEPTIGGNFKTKFEIPNEYSEIILITESDFILSNRTGAMCISTEFAYQLVERGIKEESMPVYDPNSGRMKPINYTPPSTWCS